MVPAYRGAPTHFRLWQGTSALLQTSVIFRNAQQFFPRKTRYVNPISLLLGRGSRAPTPALCRSARSCSRVAVVSADPAPALNQEPRDGKAQASNRGTPGRDRLNQHVVAHGIDPI